MHLLQSVIVVSKSLGFEALRKIHSTHQELVSKVITLDDEADPRSCKQEIIDFCTLNKIPFSILDGKQLNEFLISVKPDFCFVCGWYSLLSEASLNVCRLGVTGLHNSILPAYRGGAPLVWSVINNESKVGSSLFKMSSEMDDGDIIYQWVVDIDSESYLPQISKALEQQILANLGDVIGSYLVGEIVPQQQTLEGVSYCSQRSVEDSRVDWSLSADQLFNMNRALQEPYPPLFFDKGGQRFNIVKLSKSAAIGHGAPGKVLVNTAHGPLVKCGSGTDTVVLNHVEIVAQDKHVVSHNHFSIGALLA